MVYLFWLGYRMVWQLSLFQLFWIFVSSSMRLLLQHWPVYFHNLKLGWELFNFNVKQSKAQQQVGMWLHTWTENQKAINFYSKAGFKIIGHHDFKISETHCNPNYQMLLIY